MPLELLRALVKFDVDRLQQSAAGAYHPPPVAVQGEVDLRGKYRLLSCAVRSDTVATKCSSDLSTCLGCFLLSFQIGSRLAEGPERNDFLR